MTDGALHHVEIDDPAGTVATLKDAISFKGNLQHASVKVCFRGRVLDDDTATLPAVGLSDIPFGLSSLFRVLSPYERFVRKTVKGNLFFWMPCLFFLGG